MANASSSTPTELDLAFIIDATSSMSPYIKSAQQVCVWIFIDKRYRSFFFVEYAKNY
jgi:hypothetical protein